MTDELIHLVARDEGCVVETRGMLLSVWNAPLRTALLADIRHAVEAAQPRNPQGLTTLSIYRLDRRFPVASGFDANLSEIVKTLRAVRGAIVASASVIEFGGILGLAMRGAIATLSKLAEPRPALGVFDTPVEGLQWLQPRTVGGEGPEALAHYLRVVRSLRAPSESGRLAAT